MVELADTQDSERVACKETYKAISSEFGEPLTGNTEPSSRKAGVCRDYGEDA